MWRLECSTDVESVVAATTRLEGDYKPLGCRVHVETIEKLKQLAEAQGVPFAELVREALDKAAGVKRQRAAAGGSRWTRSEKRAHRQKEAGEGGTSRRQAAEVMGLKGEAEGPAANPWNLQLLEGAAAMGEAAGGNGEADLAEWVAAARGGGACPPVPPVEAGDLQGSIRAARALLLAQGEPVEAAAVRRLLVGWGLPLVPAERELAVGLQRLERLEGYG